MRGVSRTTVAGLAVTYDADGYYDHHLLSRDSKGKLHDLQYYPRIDELLPSVGSTAGGTQVTINGGGFSMDESLNEVWVGGKKCTITYCTIEQIVCNTTALDNSTATDFMVAIDRSMSSDDVADAWMDVLKANGDFSLVNATTAVGGSYFSDSGLAEAKVRT